MPSLIDKTYSTSAMRTGNLPAGTSVVTGTLVDSLRKRIDALAAQNGLSDPDITIDSTSDRAGHDATIVETQAGPPQDDSPPLAMLKTLLKDPARRQNGAVQLDNQTVSRLLQLMDTEAEEIHQLQIAAEQLARDLQTRVEAMEATPPSPATQPQPKTSKQ
ncbi:hypothetical protein PGTUg99_032433 [Puccinia graminis f. sp. tritici]|uniref:Uncharacterized protein n=1 Tax=Puccinia graminis f. sp. tritici TaxID=56615 RepID=A0A5B0SLD0_PUCGR|nr:hypothetical protein PGTUg99_032433 [Puccinia graminis f. sp. tritici]